ncbi:MAG: helix-turn-helix transcriptional regulator [Bacteroidetes bacterium]|nr:helix-turn-helix transcriptional regulator [Bacteroidota bacterium]
MVQNEYKPFLIALGQNIERIREKQGLTKVQLAFEINTGESYIRRLEKGEINLTIVTIMKISSALNITITELLNFEYIKLENDKL